MEGIVKFYSPARGYGFVILPDGTEVFYHIRAVVRPKRYWDRMT